MLAQSHPSRSLLSPLRRWGVVLVTAALTIGGLSPLVAAGPASAVEPSDFLASFEPGETAVPYADRVEAGADGTTPIQQNIKGGTSGSVLSHVTTVSASSENTPGEAAIFAADGDPGSKWLAFDSAAWLRYDLDASLTALSYTITSGNDSPERDPKNWTVEGWDGAAWVVIDTQTNQNWADSDRNVQQTFTVAHPGTYSSYRLNISANHGNDIIQLDDWDLISQEGLDEGPSPMITEVGSGPSTGYNMKARMGWTGTHSLKYAGEHTADGEAFATNRLFDTDIPVGVDTQLSYKIFPEFSASDLQYPSTYVAVDLHFTDGTALHDLAPLDSYDIDATALGQGQGKILYTNQWNSVTIDVGDVANGKTIDGVLLSYDNDGGSADTAFQGWLDDVSIQAHPATIDGSSLTHYVDTRRGTNSSGSFSRGSNEPITAIPNGFNFLLPVTNALATSREYAYQQDNNAQNLPRFEGLGVSHEPSPWMGDRNQFSVMPVTGGSAPSGNPDTRAGTFRHSNETAQPDYYGVQLDNGVKAEMTPSNRGMVMQFTFPSGSANSVVLDSPTGDGSFTIDQATGNVTGWIDHGTGFVAGQSRMFVSGRFDAAPTATGTAAGGRSLTKFATFDTTANKTVTLRLATSLISLDQAAHNLDLEVGTQSFDAVRASASQIWNERLGVISVEGASQTQLQTLYSNLYRLNVYPNAQFENTGSADAPVYQYASPVSDKTGQASATQTNANVVDGKMSVNNGFWDTYRTVWTTYSMLYPDVAADLVDGFTDQFRDGGWIARWSSPGYADIMTGTSSDAAFADAYLRGVQLPDALETYDAAFKNATTPSNDDSAVGRKSLVTSEFLGYTPASQGESVSWGLEGYINDFGIGNMAAGLAADPNTPEERRQELSDQSEYFLDRATNYVNMFDPSVGFFQAKNADGSFSTPTADYDPTVWWGPYTETNGWNFAFHAPQDPQGLANLYGGQKGLEDKLDQFFATPETTMGGIHEEVEARDARFGEWGVSNQVSHHIPFLYNAAGAPAKAQKIVREALQRVFTGSDIGQGYPGDEDNGEMSSWYVLNSLGLYPLQAGSNELVIGSPAFTKATIQLAGGKSLVINAQNNSAKNVYVQSLSINGEAYDKTSIDSNLLMQGGELDFVMGDTPSDWGTAPEDAPPSITQGADLAKPLVDTTDSGIATTVSAGGENTASLVDNSSATQVVFGSPTPQVSVAYPGAKQRPTFYTLTSGATPGTDPSAWTLEGSDDGQTWTTVDTRSGESFAYRGETQPFKIQNPGTFQQYRLSVTAGGASVSLAEFELLTNGTGTQAGDLVVSGAQGLTGSSSIEKDFSLGILSGGTGTSETDYTATVDWGDGSAPTDATIAAPKVGNYGISASHTYAAPGVYQAKVTATDGTSTASAPVSITVDYVEPGGLRAGYDSVCIADDGVGANCDAKGLSFPRAGLAAGTANLPGLVAGQEASVPGTDLTFTLPVVPVGAPDNALNNGQTIAVDLGEGATSLSFIGAATEHNMDTVATVNFTDGTSDQTPLQFSDWTKGGNAGATAPYGNIGVAESTYRLVGGTPSGTHSFFFSTVPYEIPEGKTVESVTMPPKLADASDVALTHVFAIASNGVHADESFTAAAGQDIQAKTDEALTPVLATATLGTPDSVQPQGRVQWGDGSVTEDATVTAGTDGTLQIGGAHTYTTAGTYAVSVTVYTAQQTQQLSLTATIEAPVVYSPVLDPTSSDGVLAGSDVHVTGSGFAPGENVSVELQTDEPVTVSAIADGAGAIDTTVTVPASAEPARYAIVAHGEVSQVPASTTVLVTPPVVPPVYEPVVRADAETGRPGDTVTVSGTGFAPNEGVRVEFHSDPVVLGTPSTDLHGALTFTFTVPADATVGDHEIVLNGAVSQVPITLAFEVLPQARPGDGSDAANGPTDPASIDRLSQTGLSATGLAPTVVLAVLVLAAGATILLVRRRRRPAE